MNSKTKIFITIVSGVLLSLVAVLFGFQPLLANVKQLNETLGQKQSELIKIEKQIVEFKSAQTDLARATFKDDVYGTVVIREDLGLAIQDLEGAAEKTETTESIQISEPVQEQGRRGNRAAETKNVFEGLTLSEEVRYTMNIRNDYEGFVTFMQYLENLPHFTEFDSIILNAVVENESTASGGVSRNTGAVTGTLEGVFLVKKNGQAD
jgi:hypothetical protein